MIKKDDFARFKEVIIASYRPHLWHEGLTPFQVLVSVVLSQATERRGNIKAYKNLKNRFEITPQNFRDISQGELAELIKPAGLHQNKSKVLKGAALAIIEDYGGDLARIFEPIEEARGRLIALPGVGAKTADVVLALAAHQGVFPVDTHIARIAKRLPLVGQEAKYEEIKAAYESWTPKEERLFLHMALIEHGRKVCKSQHPRCGACQIKDICGRVGVDSS